MENDGSHCCRCLSCSAIADAQEPTGQTGSGEVQLNPEILTGFIQHHCQKCHGPKKPKGKLRLETLSLEISDIGGVSRAADEPNDDRPSIIVVMADDMSLKKKE